MEMDTWEKIQYECASNGVCRYNFNRKRRVLEELVRKHLEAAVVRAVLKEVEGGITSEGRVAPNATERGESSDNAAERVKSSDKAM